MWTAGAGLDCKSIVVTTLACTLVVGEMGEINLHVLADDLTGALDSTAPFARSDRSLAVVWHQEYAGRSATAIDSASREASEAESARRHRDLAAWLFSASLPFKKIDSLLRGHVVADVAALATAAPDCRLVIAPAFPHQGRVTREGRQWRHGEAEPVGPDLSAELLRRGLSPDRGTAVRDAATDDDLDALVRCEAARPGPILWVGSGGLAAALARNALSRTVSARPRLEGPVLALIGSDHPITREQVSRAGEAHVVLAEDGAGHEMVATRLRRGCPCVATVAVRGERQEAGARIARAFSRLLANCARPGLLFVSGGETLRGVADALGATGLRVEGALEPGLPVSRLVGGCCDGLAVISKSGAFGAPDVLGAIFDRVREG